MPRLLLPVRTAFHSIAQWAWSFSTGEGSASVDWLTDSCLAATLHARGWLPDIGFVQFVLERFYRMSCHYFLLVLIGSAYNAAVKSIYYFLDFKTQLTE